MPNFTYGDSRIFGHRVVSYVVLKGINARKEDGMLLMLEVLRISVLRTPDVSLTGLWFSYQYKMHDEA